MSELTEQEIKEQRKQQEKERERIAKSLIKLAGDEEFEYGITNAVLVLSGTTDETIDQNDLQEHKQYGELSEYPHQELKEFAKKLANHQFLDRREVGNYAYVIERTQKGERFLEAEEELPLIVLPRTQEEREAANKSSDEISFEMFCQGKNVEAIAEERNLETSTIYSHLESFVKKGELDADELINEESLSTIGNHLESDAVDLSSEVYLSNIKEELPNDITYDEIKIVLAEYQNS